MGSLAARVMQPACSGALRASWQEPQRRLTLAVAASLLLHSFLMVGIRPEPARPGTFAALQARIVPVSAAEPAAIVTPRLSALPQEIKTSPAPKRVVQAPNQGAPAAVTAGRDEQLEQGSSLLPAYHASQDVDVRAVPKDLSNRSRQERSMLLGRVVKVKLRLYISATGTVDRFDLIEADGLTPAVSLDEVHDIRFHPALKNGLPVASRKLVELSFVP
jgi:hypothetical protein